MEVFHCEVEADRTVPNYNGPGLAEGKPPGLSVCRKVIGAWAMGASVSSCSINYFSLYFILLLSCKQKQKK